MQRAAKPDFTPVKRTRSEFVKEAYTWMGTPFALLQLSGQWEKGKRADCIFFAQVLRDLHMYQYPRKLSYTASPRQGLIRSTIAEHLEEVQSVENGPIDFSKLKHGQIGLFYFQDVKEPQHCAIILNHPVIPGGQAMLHAFRKRGKIVDGGLSNDRFWRPRLQYVFEVPNIIDDPEDVQNG